MSLTLRVSHGRGAGVKGVGSGEGDDASALALVISLNVQRRDLTAAQRALVAARTVNAPRGRPSKNGTDSAFFSTDEAAKTFKVGVNAVKQAKALLTDAPDLAAQ